MTPEEAIAEVEAEFYLAKSHNEAHPLGHIGCMPGSPCDGDIMLSREAAQTLVSHIRAYEATFASVKATNDTLAREALAALDRAQKAEADLEWRTTERQAAKFTASGYKNRAEKAEALAAKMADVLQGGCEYTAVMEVLGEYKKSKLAWLSDPNDGVGEPDPMAGPE